MRVALIALIGALALFVWWLERDRARHVDRPPTPAAHEAAARMTLREIQTAQELHAAEHDGRYGMSLDSLRVLDPELSVWLEPARGVIARLDAGVDGAWYVAEVAHRAVPGFRCRVASDSAPAVRAGALRAWEESCAPRDAER